MARGKAFQRLVAHKMALDAVPRGGGFGEVIEFLQDPQRIGAAARAADAWAATAVQAIREARDPNPWRDASDEEIAAEIMRRAEREKETR